MSPLNERAPKLDREQIAGTFQQALALHRGGDPAAAARLYEAILEADPRHADSLHMLGGVALQSRQHQRGVDLISRAIAINPAIAPAHLNLAGGYRALGRYADAVSSCDRAIALRPDYAEAHASRGDALSDLRRPHDALASYDQAIALRPDYAQAYSSRGSTLNDLKRPEDALVSCDHAIALRADYPEAYSNRSIALRDLKRFEDALASCDRAIALRPDYAQAHLNRGNTLVDLARPEDALASYEKAIALKPDFVEAYDNKSILLSELGRFSEANDASERAIAIAPSRIRSYYNLTQSKRLTLDDPHVGAMQALERNLPSLAVDEQIDLQFALAKVFADCGEPAAGFQRLLAANALKRSRTPYDETASLSGFEGIRAAFSAELMSAHKGQGAPSDRPVFVVGMPRSGSTLVEQILASHPKVFGAGEVNGFAEAVAALDAKAREASGAGVSHLSGRQLRELGESYLRRIGAAAPWAARITDKTLENFRFVGLIHLTLPNARIVHVRRDPIDTCLSCFSKLFLGDFPFVYDLAELGRYYRAYAALMTHWSDVLPDGVMIDVQYEDVVADLEGEARRLVAHCGLEWTPRCLDFHLTERAVRTGSNTQVRQPIFTSSVGRWRAYEPFIKPLLDELQPLAPARSSPSEPARPVGG